MHGGYLTGGYRGGSTKPATAARARKVTLLHALGLRWYGGAPRKPAKVRTMVDDAREKLTDDIVTIVEALPGLSGAGEQLGRAAVKGLGRLEQILDMELDEHDPKQMRLIGDMALGVCKLFQRAAEGAFRAQEGSQLIQLLEQLKAQQISGTAAPKPDK